MSNNTITATELAENLSDVLDRVKRDGESFTVKRDGEPIADIAPRLSSKGMTLNELFDLLDELGQPDDDFAADVRESREMHGYPTVVDWPS